MRDLKEADPADDARGITPSAVPTYIVPHGQGNVMALDLQGTPICDTIGVDVPPGSVGRYQQSLGQN